jgi:hypothetical protein
MHERTRRYQVLMLGTLGALASICAVASCGADPHPSPTVTVAETRSHSDDPAPSFSVVVVNNLHSCVADCGCSGNNRGSLARVRSAARGQARLFVFAGTTIFTPSQLETLQGEPSDPELRQAAYQVRAMAAYLREMSPANLLLNESELAVLENLKGSVAEVSRLEPYVVRSNQISTPFGTLTSANQTVLVNGIVEFAEYPPASSRARRVLVIDYWESDSTRPAHRSKELDALLPLSWRIKNGVGEINRSAEQAAEGRSIRHGSLSARDG